MKHKILIVEDESIVAKDIENTLKALDYQVVGIASTGEDAVHKASSLVPDLILMDIVLKTKMTGIEATRQIKSALDVPVVYLTAYSDDELLQAARATGPLGYIVKPFDEKTLHTTIDMALYKHRIDRELMAAKQNFEELYHNAPDGYISLGSDRKITLVNTTLLKMTGFSKSDLLNNDCHLLFPHDTGSFQAGMKNVELDIKTKSGSAIPVLVNSRPFFDQDGNYLHTRTTIRDISNLKQLEKEKDILNDKVIKLTKKIPLTDNEKVVLYHVVREPLLNDVELSDKLAIKRTTITSIRNRLQKEKFFNTMRIPNFAAIGCELMTIFYANLNLAHNDNEAKSTLFSTAMDVPEQVYLAATQKELIGFCLSRNITDAKRHMDSITSTYRQTALTKDFSTVLFPLGLTNFEKLDFSHFLANLLELKQAAPKTITVQETPKTLTQNEKIILYALVRFPQLNDSELADMTGLPRPSISQTRRKLLDLNLVQTVAVPNFLQTRSELLVFTHVNFLTGQADQASLNFREHIKNLPETAVMMSTENELCFISVFDDYSDFELQRNNEASFYLNPNIRVQQQTIFPVTQTLYQKLDFAPLVKKLLGLNVNF